MWSPTTAPTNRPRRVYILLDNSVYSQAYTFLYTDSNGNLINYEDAPFVPGVSYLWDLNLDPSRVVSCDVIYMAKDSSEPDIAILKASQDVPNQTPLPLLAKSEDAPVGSEIYALGFPSDSDSASTVDDNFEPVSEIEDGVYIWQMISETQLLATPSDVTVTDGIISRHTTYGADHIQVIQVQCQVQPRQLRRPHDYSRRRRGGHQHLPHHRQRD